MFLLNGNIAFFFLFHPYLNECREGCVRSGVGFSLSELQQSCLQVAFTFACFGSHVARLH